MLQTIVNGLFNGATQKYILWPTRGMFMTSMRFGETERRIFKQALDAFEMEGLRAKHLREFVIARRVPKTSDIGDLQS